MNAACSNCGSWQRQALDYGHCWSGDRLDDEFANGPADITYPNDRCEAHWSGTFDRQMIAQLGGDPDRAWADAERARCERSRAYLASIGIAA